jgi:nicotinamide-nucleotide amidase
VAYSNDVKMSVLGVESKALENFGAVSKEVVEQMAVGVRRLMKVDFAVATSGVAGPTGGSDEKPVGTVWIAVSSAEGVKSCMYVYGKERVQNIERTTQTAFLMLKEFM